MKLKVKDVMFSYSSEPVLKDICFELAPSEVLGIVGPNVEMIKIVGAWDRVVTTDYNARDEVLFPRSKELPLIDGPASIYDLNFEVVFEARPYIFFTLRVPQPEFIDVIANLENGIINHCIYPIHMSHIDGINNKIKVIKRKVYGFHDIEYFSLIIKDSFVNSV